MSKTFHFLCPLLYPKIRFQRNRLTSTLRTVRTLVSFYRSRSIVVTIANPCCIGHHAVKVRVLWKRICHPRAEACLRVWPFLNYTLLAIVAVYVTGALILAASILGYACLFVSPDDIECLKVLALGASNKLHIIIICLRVWKVEIYI